MVNVGVFTVSENCCVAVLLAPSDTFTVKVNVPAV